MNESMNYTRVCFMCGSLIHGFISKEDARNKLQDAPLGTFLLRFSETNIVDVDRKDPSINGHGYLTLAVNEQDPYNGQFSYHQLQYCTLYRVGQKK